VAATRLRVRLADPARMDLMALKSAGVQAIQELDNGEKDLVVGLRASGLVAYLR